MQKSRKLRVRIRPDRFHVNLNVQSSLYCKINMGEDYLTSFAQETVRIDLEHVERHFPRSRNFHCLLVRVLSISTILEM